MKRLASARSLLVGAAGAPGGCLFTSTARSLINSKSWHQTANRTASLALPTHTSFILTPNLVPNTCHTHEVA